MALELSVCYYSQTNTESSPARTMTHFRGYVRGPHWGLTMDSMLIDFWGRHACLFNSSDVSFNDRELKTRLWSEFAASIGKSGEPFITCEAVGCHEAVGNAPGSAFD